MPEGVRYNPLSVWIFTAEVGVRVSWFLENHAATIRQSIICLNRSKRCFGRGRGFRTLPLDFGTSNSPRREIEGCYCLSDPGSRQEEGERWLKNAWQRKYCSGERRDSALFRPNHVGFGEEGVKIVLPPERSPKTA